MEEWLHITWKYKWESPNPAQWSSDYVFDSYELAKRSAVWHARNQRKRKYLHHLEPDSKQLPLVWRSMRKAGWRIRKRKDIK